MPPALRRELIISCGAALYNLRLAIRVTGHDLAVWLLPGDSGPLVLASVEIVTGRTKRPTVTEQESTTRSRDATPTAGHTMTHPVPTPILVAMQHAAGREQGRLRLSAAPGQDMAACGSRRGREQGPARATSRIAQWANGGDSGVPAAAFGPPGTFGHDHHLGRHPAGAAAMRRSGIPAPH